MIDLRNEAWSDIPEFPDYQISSLGRVYNNRTERMMSISQTNYGHMKVSLVSPNAFVVEDEEGSQRVVRERITKSVAVLVAEAFVPRPNEFCDHIIVLDGDFTNVVAHNLAWRPSRFAYLYTRQLKETQPRHYENLPVVNVSKGILYQSIVDAGMAEGLLFDDIWKCTYTHLPAFPTGDRFEIPHDE